MIIKDSASLDAFRARYGDFHDSLVKRVDVVSGSKFETHAPWEAPVEVGHGAQRLQSVGLAFYGGQLIRMVILHYNFDWPNQPFDREIWLTIPRPISWAEDICRHVGTGVFDLSAQHDGDAMTMTLRWHEWRDRPADGPWYCSMENARKAVLWTAKRFHASERRWGLKEAGP